MSKTYVKFEIREKPFILPGTLSREVQDQTGMVCVQVGKPQPPVGYKSIVHDCPFIDILGGYATLNIYIQWTSSALLHVATGRYKLKTKLCP